VSSLTEPTVPSSRDDILVVGAGATGGFFGALLAGHGRDVTFLVRATLTLRVHEQRIQENASRVPGEPPAPYRAAPRPPTVTQ